MRHTRKLAPEGPKRVSKCKCGVWPDPSELPTVPNFIPAGDYLSCVEGVVPDYGERPPCRLNIHPVTGGDQWWAIKAIVGIIWHRKVSTLTVVVVILEEVDSGGVSMMIAFPQESPLLKLVIVFPGRMA